MMCSKWVKDDVLMMRLIGVIFALLLLAGCSGGASLLDEEFQEVETLPETLRGVDLVTELLTEGRDTGLLRLIVTQPGRNQNGILWMNLDEAPADSSFAVRGRVRAGQMRLWLRTDENLCSGYVLTIDPTLDRYRLSLAQPDCSLRMLDDRSRMEVNLDTWYEVRIEARGSTIRGFVDTVQFFEVTDETYSSGIPALEVY
ncbi:MAG: hypothetical protein KC496_06790, partial [Anaerolineae bacterium]|nr:hypothetical protein [Anaerolineae bacterium]